MLIERFKERSYNTAAWSWKVRFPSQSVLESESLERRILFGLIVLARTCAGQRVIIDDYIRLFYLPFHNALVLLTFTFSITDNQISNGLFERLTYLPSTCPAAQFVLLVVNFADMLAVDRR